MSGLHFECQYVNIDVIPINTVQDQENTKCKLVYYVVWFFHSFPRKSAYKKANSTKTNLTFSTDA